MQHPYISVSFAVILKKKKRCNIHQRPWLQAGSEVWRQQRLNRLRLCLASNDRSEFRASGGGEVTAVRCAGGCRGLKGQLSLLSAREQQEQKM